MAARTTGGASDGAPDDARLPWAAQLAHRLERVFNAIVGGFILVMAVAVCWQVVGRYVFDSAPAWSEELSRYLMVWVAMIGCAAVLRSGGHMSVTAVLDQLPPAGQAVLLWLRDILFAGVLLVLIWFGVKIALLMSAQQTATLKLSMAWVYAALPVGSVLTLLILVLTRLAGTPFRATDEGSDEPVIKD